MSVVVQKYGGTSVADAARIGNVARRIVATFEQGNSVCAVVSARGDTTDELLELAREITPDPPEREMDMLLSAGERISCALLAMAIHRLGYDAVSLTGSQAGIVTDTVHMKARILDIHPMRVKEAMEDGKIVLVAGFQGVSTAKDVTTLGRGGSDTTAVALAHALEAAVCEIYTDVDGVYTANPSLVAKARKLDPISYDEMLEMAASGAQVLALRSVEYARKYDIPIHVRSSFTDAEGTWVTDGGHGMDIEQQLEQPIIRAVSYTTDEAKVTLRGVPDRPGVAARVFTALAEAPRQRRHHHPEHQRERPQRHLVHHPGRGHPRRRQGAQGDRQGARRARVRHRRRDRQDQPDRRRHAQPPRRRRQDVPDAGRSRHQPGHDRHLAHQDLVRHRQAARRRGRARAAHGVRARRGVVTHEPADRGSC